MFLAISAGSLNGANQRLADNRVIFESQYTMQHLKLLGIPENKIFGDIFSWDTITNGLYLRQYVEGYFVTCQHKNCEIIIEVFISDFHLNRIRASFEWILSLKPNLSFQYNLIMHAIPSTNIFQSNDLSIREKHELEGLKRIERNKNKIKSLPDLYHFLYVGGHVGISSYLHGTYNTTRSVGY